MPLSFLKNIYYPHDGAAAHKAINVNNWLNKNFSRQWIGCKGPTKCPPRFPDLTPLDFFLFGRL